MKTFLLKKKVQTFLQKFTNLKVKEKSILFLFEKMKTFEATKKYDDF